MRMRKGGNMQRAVFLDRDGTLIEDRGHLRSSRQVVFIPGAFDALRRLRKDYLLFIVTHQPGIAKGLITRSEANSVNRYLVGRLAQEGIAIKDVYVCPHRREDLCACIKPRGYFLEGAATRYGIDLARSFTVGDHPHDVTLADSVGARGIYVLTGHGKKHRTELSPGALVVRDIADAARHILAARA
jgi:histidinol-phosphate phosphatase family protein